MDRANVKPDRGQTASLIVINWNGAAFLDACLNALLAEVVAGDEILVVDNNSTDQSVALVHSHFPDLTVLCNERNLGYAGGANVGLRAAQGEVLILLNPDVQVHPGWLATLKDALQEEQVGVVGCKLYFPGDEVIQHAGGVINLPQATGSHHGYHQRDEGQWDQVREVDYVTGAAFALRRDIVDRVGSFDEAFYPAYYEEADFCFRAREAGFRVLYVPQATATHHEIAALGKESYLHVRYVCRNRLRFVLKHYGPHYFLDQFVPAEKEQLKQRRGFYARRAFSSAYLDMMLGYPKLHLDHWGITDEDNEDVVNNVLEALVGLRNLVWSG